MIIDAPKLECVPALRALWREAFGDGDEFLDTFFDTAFSKERCRVAIDGERTVGALYWFDCSFKGKSTSSQ